jgi:N-hydroxyarylamine O-acetyltransferase
MDHETVVAYLDRVGVTTPAVSDAAGLRTLHRAHQLTVPFENLSIHLAEPISLDEPDLIDKIVRRRRGGFCYELNGAFALLLEALGAQVSRVGARVYGEAGLSPPLDHLALIVRPADGTGPWLADVGFGSHSDYPLLLDTRDDQDDPAGRFRLADASDTDVDVLRDGKPQYRLEMRERSLADCVPTCWWQQTSPLSHFTQSTICSRLTPDGRVSIGGRMLIQTRHGSRTEQQLDTDDALLAAYRDHFGIALSRIPDDPAERRRDTGARLSYYWCMMWCMKRTNIYLAEGQADALDRVAQAAGVSRAELIRELIDRAIGGHPGADLVADLAAIDGSFGILAGQDAFAREPDERMSYLERLADA